MKVSKEDKSMAHMFVSNYISTTKYSLITFLPLGLLYQFFRLSNCYFLFMVILQCMPFSPLAPTSAVMPFVFVLTLSLAREAYEDYQRYKSDKGKYNAFFGFLLTKELFFEM